MAYDPQANRRRPRPVPDDPAPVDALLGDADPHPAPTGEVGDDPPPVVAVTPAPADPPPDSLLIKTVVAAVAGTVATLLVLRWLWLHRRWKTRPKEERESVNS